MTIDRDTLTPEQELELERHNGRRLAAVLRLANSQLDEARHLVIGLPVSTDFTLGNAIDGALACHTALREELDQ